MSLVIVIDGVCVMCSTFAKFVVFFNPAARFMWAQHETGKLFLRSHNISDDRMDSIVVVRDGKVFRQSDAFIQVLLTMNWFWKLVAMLIAIIPRVARDWCYMQVANNRYKILGKRESCGLGSKEMKSKFLHSI